MDPDPYTTLSKLGSVTIQRVPQPAVSTSENTHEPSQTTSKSEITEPDNKSQPIHLPKLPSSINITIKTNDNTPSTSESPTNDASTDENILDDRDDERVSVEHSEEKSDEISNGITSAEHPPQDSKPMANDTDPLLENDACEDDKPKSVIEEMEAEETTKDDDNDVIQTSGAVFNDEELPEIKREFAEEVRANELGAETVSELNESVLPEDAISKDEPITDNENEEANDPKAENDNDEGETDKEQEDTKDKKKKRKTKSDDDENDPNDAKKQKTSGDKTDDKDKTEVKSSSLRKNIREVMHETKLDEATLAAQMQEKERLRRVQEQLRATRDAQRQMMQAARVISLIEKSSTSIVKKEEEETPVSDEQKQNTVVVKLSSGSGPTQIVNKKMLDLLKKQNSSSASDEEEVPVDKIASLSKNLNKPQMMTASVSIAPVKQDQSKIEEKTPTTESDNNQNKDIVMISSSSESEEQEEEEDDDCIVISEDEPSEEEEDTGNSGMHTNDLYNVPDEQGRVLINVGHAENEEDVFLAPQIARIIKPHQIGGVRFLFDNIVESLERYRTSEGFGCILAHSMGLGKTLQVISFCDVFLRYTEGRTVLCVMPINTLQNWVAEFNMWLPVDADSSRAKEHGEVLPRKFPLFVLNDNHKTLTARTKVIQNWYKDGGVLLIGYELYRQLSLKKVAKSRTRSKKRYEAEEDLDDEKSKSLLELINNALIKPGPDLIICDEGHRIKNSHASISHALKQIRSKRRVVLTGYPLQNNLLEYWCMVDFVRPNYLGTKTEFSNMFERPIQNGQCIDSTPQDVKLMRYRAHVLHSLLEGFVQRRSHRVLQQSLPTKYEFVLLLRFTPFQRKLYNTFMNDVVRTKAVPNPLKAFAVCCKIWNHPDILYNFLKKRAGEEDIDLDLEEAVTSIGTPASGPSTPMTPSTPPHQLTNKRPRGRASRGSQNDDTKTTRKNARCGASPQPSKPLAVATVQPNTANERKPSPCDETATNTINASPISSFDGSTFGSPYRNNYGGAQTTDNDNYATQSIGCTSNANQTSSFGNQYSQPQQQQQQQRQPDFGGISQQMNVVANQDFGNNAAVNYQQNAYNDQTYFQPEYNQNYWQGSDGGTGGGGGDNGGNFYNANSNTIASNEEFYQSSSSSGQNRNEQQQQQQQSFCTNEYAAAAAAAGGGHNNSMQSNFSGQNYNYDVNQQLFGDGADMGGFDAANAAGLMDPTNLLNDFSGNVFATNDFVGGQGTGQNAAAAKRIGRPQLQDGAGKYKRNVATDAFANFKPGLLGGAPILKSADAGYRQNGGDTNESVAYSQQPQLMNNLRNDAPWNSVVDARDANSMFHNQNYPLYNEPQQQNASFLGNEGTAATGTSLLGGVRASRGILNEIQSENLFGSSTAGSSTNYTPGNVDANLFVDNFGYLNDLPLPSHSSFMGLLEGVDDLETTNQNMVETGAGTVDGGHRTPQARQNNGRTTMTSTDTNQTPSNQSSSVETFGSSRNFSGGICQSRTVAPPSSTQTNWDAFGNTSTTTTTTNDRDANSGQATFAKDASRTTLSIHNDNNNLEERQLKDELANRFAANRNVSLIAAKKDEDGADTKQQTTIRNVASGVSQQLPVGAVKASSSSSFVSRGTDNTHMLETAAATQTSNIEAATSFGGSGGGVGCGVSAAKSGELDDGEGKMAPPETPTAKGSKEEPGIPYDWANDFFKDYESGKIEESAKTLVFFCMLDQIIKLGDRLLLFSQSLFTLDLIEDYLHLYNIPNKEEKWARNKNYFRLDGSTNSLEREKLINEFNNNPNIHLFLVSTRAGSLGINLVGANRVVVFDASWNPCHDTQAVCRVYRYGQQKSCYVYRFVMDHCMEKKIYDRQINKQGISDRIVDECNPDAYLTIKDVSNLCYDAEDENETKCDFGESKSKYNDVVVQRVVDELSWCLSKPPFQHESLLVDRTDKKLSQAEKRMAKRGYELEKQASLKPSSYGFYNPPLGIQNRMGKPMASVRPMLADNSQPREQVRRWIPAEVWQKQGMNAQEMTLPSDVVIPTGTPDSQSFIRLEQGQNVMVLKNSKGIYMQLENGKIIAIKTEAQSSGGNGGAGSGSGPVKTITPNRQQISQTASTMGPQSAKKFVDHPSLAALSSRRDVTVSPIRNRFPISQTNMTRPNAPRLSSGIRPNQLIPRQYPMQQQRLLGRPPMPRQIVPRSPMISQMPSTTGGNKPMFGRNSAVTISVPNRRRTEMGNVTGNEKGAPHSIEIRNDEYASNARAGINEMRKLPASGYHEFPGGVRDNGPNVRGSSFGHTLPSRDAKNSLMQTRRGPTMPDILRNKRDVNLTPSSGLNNEREKISSGYQQQQRQQQYSALSQQQSRTSQSSFQNAVRRMPPHSSSQSPKVPPIKDAAVKASSTIPVELPKNKSISIFPVGKKTDDGSPQQRQSAAFLQPESNQPQYQQQATKSGSYYGNFGGGKQSQQQQQYGNYAAAAESQPQYSGQYETYKQNYQPSPPNYAQSSNNYSQTQQQQSYASNAQYQTATAVSYPNNDFNQPSPYQNQMFANSSNAASNAATADFDQFGGGSYFNNGPQQSQSSSQLPLP